MNERELDPRLQPYLDGELSPAERADLEADLAASPALAAELERLRRVNDLARGSDTPQPADGHAARMAAAVAAAPRRWWELWLPGLGRPGATAAWGLATTCVLAMLLAPLSEAGLPRLSALVGPDDGYVPVNDSMAAAPAEGEAAGAAFEPAPLPADADAVEAAPAGGAVAPAADIVLSAEPAPRAPTRAAMGDAVAGAEATDLAVSARSKVREAEVVPPIDAAQTAPLQAGEIDDNATYGKYLKYIDENPPPSEDQSRWQTQRARMQQRYVVQVVDAQGHGVADAEVELTGPPYERAGSFHQALSVRTDSSGQAVAYLHDPQSRRVRVAVRRGERSTQRDLELPPEGGVVRIEWPEAPPVPSPMAVDVAFIVDTTGSMSEEIARIRETIDEVAARIGQLPQPTRLRLGLVLYRDQYDEYVTRALPFTADVAAFQANLASVQAQGGGDTPEDVEAGLQAALAELDWAQAPALRMAFLIGDAPAHASHRAREQHWLSAGERLAEAGIKLFAVSTSGQDDYGEFVWRYLAQRTRGRFLFITKGGQAGITPHHVERQDYTVQALPDLVVQAVARELAALGRAPGDVPLVELPPPPQPPPAPVVEPPAPQPPRDIERLPAWAFWLIVMANALGWGYAWHRSRLPLRRAVAQQEP